MKKYENYYTKENNNYTNEKETIRSREKFSDKMS